MKKYKILIAILLILLTICAVSANDENTASDELTVSEDLSLESEEVDDVIADSVNDEVDEVSLTDDVKLNSSGSVGTFSDLSTLVENTSEGNILELDKDYQQESNHEIEISKAMTIDGKGHSIDANKASKVFTINSNVTLKNILFKNSLGTAVSFYNGGNVVDCSFVNCSFELDYSLDDMDALFDSLENNASGGAIYFKDNGTVVECSFVNCSSEGYGGAINFKKRGTVVDCSFVNCSSKGCGGAINCYDSVTVANCSFVNCSASDFIISTYEYEIYMGGGGGAIYTPTGNVTNCSFVDCSSQWNQFEPDDDDYSMGSAIHYFNVCNIVDCSFINCTTHEHNWFDENESGGNSKFGTFEELHSKISNNLDGTLDIYEDYLGSGNEILISASVTIDGHGHILDADHKSRIFCIGCSNVIIKNFIFLHGHDDSYGGAIYTDYNTKFINCTFIDCYAYSKGGAIYGGSAYDCNFRNCQSYDGGACSGTDCENCNFNDCIAYFGGGVCHLHKDGGKIINCTFTNVRSFDSATTMGAICYSQIVKDSTFINCYSKYGIVVMCENVENCKFIDCYSEEESVCSADIKDSVFINCRSYRGSIISNNQIENCSFYNSSKIFGGTAKDCYFENCTSSSGAAVCCDYTNCIFKNCPENITNTSAHIQYILNNAEEGSTIEIGGYYILNEDICIFKKLNLIFLDDFICKWNGGSITGYVDNVKCINSNFSNIIFPVSVSDHMPHSFFIGIAVENCSFTDCQLSILGNVINCEFINTPIYIISDSVRNSKFVNCNEMVIRSAEISNCNFEKCRNDDSYKRRIIICSQVNNCNFTQCYSRSYISESSQINNCNFINCTSKIVKGSETKSVIEECFFSNCGDIEGALFNCDIRNSEFIDCDTKYGYLLVDCDYSQCSFINCSSNYIDLKTQIDNANDGDTITVSGTYKFKGTPIEINKKLTIIGNELTLNGNDMTRIFNITADNVILKNINFKDCYSKEYGGAILLEGNNLTLINCSFENCHAKFSGGAIQLSNYSDCNLINSSFVRCYTPTRNGELSGVITGSNVSSDENPQISRCSILNCNFVDCTHKSNIFPNVYIYSTNNVTFIRCGSCFSNNLENCTFIGHFEGIVNSIPNGTISIVNCAFIDCYIDLYNMTCVYIDDSYFKNNGEESIKLKFSNLTIANSKFENKRAIDSQNSNLTIINCNFTDNFTAYSSPLESILHVHGGNVSISNSIFKDCAQSLVKVDAYAMDGSCNIINSTFMNCINTVVLRNVKAYNCLFINCSSSEDAFRGCIFTDCISAAHPLKEVTYENSFAYIQDLIDNASDGDCLNISGHYYGINPIKINTPITININKPITIIGNNLTLDGQTISQILTINSTNVVLKNIEFIEGHYGGSGGAILSYSNSTTIDNCTFLYCYSGYNGGAVYLGGSNSLINNSKFISCYSNENCGGVSSSYNSNQVNYCIFENCSSGYHCGALGACHASYCDFINCYSMYGGAIEFGSASYCNFINCSAEYYGGAAYYVTFCSDCNFTDCHAGNKGGAIAVEDENATGCIFINCTSDNGGALYECDYRDGTFIDCFAGLDSGLWIDVDDKIILGSNITIYVYTATNYNGNLTAFVNDIEYTLIGLSNGKYCLKFNNIASGYYTVKVQSSATDIFLANEKTYEFRVALNPNLVITNPGDIHIGENALVHISINENVTGNFNVQVDWNDYPFELVQGSCILNITGLARGYHSVNVYFDGDDKFYSQNARCSFYVNLNSPNIKFSADTIYEGQDADVTVSMDKDATGNVIVKVDGEVQDVNFNDGVASFTLTGLSKGTHTINVEYWGDEKFSSDYVEFKLSVTSNPETTDLKTLISELEDDAVLKLTKDYGITETINIEKGITIDGNGHIIDANGLTRIFSLKAWNIVLKNIVFKNSHATSDGGAVYIDCVYNCKIISCSFINCSDTRNGGAISNFWGENLMITSCNFKDCHAKNGGAINNWGENCNISSCNFINCSADENGAAIFNDDYDCIVDSCNFTDCYTKDNIFTRFSSISGTNIVVHENCIYHDTLGHDANTFTYLKAMINSMSSGSTLVLDKDFAYDEGFTKEGIKISKSITIDGNGHIIDAKGLARIFTLSEAGIILKNIVFKNGHATSDGGAVNNDWVNNCIIISCSFINCSDTRNGGAINNFWGENLMITSCNFTYCQAVNGGAINNWGENCNISFCNFINCHASEKGGAIFSDDYVCIVNSCSFTNCYSQINNNTLNEAIYDNARNKVIVENCIYSDVDASYGDNGTSTGGNGYSGDSNGTSATETYPAMVTAKDLEMSYSDGSSFEVTVYGTDGKVASDVSVVIKIGGKKVKTIKTNANGVATYKPTVVPGKYKITAIALGKTVTKKLTVKQILTLKTDKIKKSAKKLVLQATLAKINGKYLKGKQIIFKFNGKTYKVKTNAKGVAKVTIKSKVLKKLKVGKKVTYQATYLEDTVKKSVKVKK